MSKVRLLLGSSFSHWRSLQQGSRAGHSHDGGPRYAARTTSWHRVVGISAATLLVGVPLGVTATSSALAQVPAGVTIDPVNNDVSPSPATTPTWDIGGGTLIIGNTGNGELTIGDGGSVDISFGYLGLQLGSEGKATVAGGSWTSSDHLYVGWDGRAEMNIGANGTVSNTFGVVASSATSTASVTVAGQGARWTNDALYIGYDGKGALDIGAGGRVISTIGALGASTDSEGRATVAGAGALWNNSVRLYVGWDAMGDLTIRDGGHVAIDAGHGELLLGHTGTAIGTLAIGAAAGSTPAAAGTLAAGQISFGDGIATLVFNHTDPGYVFAPALVSTGAGTHTIQQLAGTTRLTGDSSGFAGNTTVSGGTLLVGNGAGSAALGGTIRVEASGTLGGNGTVGDTLINGGVLSPGNSIGALTVAGNLVLTAASTYMVEVSPTSSDFTHVTGTATLGGATVAAHFASGSYVEKRYTILTAGGGINGTFAGPAYTDLPANFKSALSYDGTNAFLDLTLALRQEGLSDNQGQVADTLVNYFDRTGGIPLAFGGLDPRGLSQASGEVATTASQAAFDAQGQFLNSLTDPFVDQQCPRERRSLSCPPMAMGYAAPSREGRAHDAYAALFTKAAPPAAHFEQRWRVFGGAYGGSARINGNAGLGSHDATARVYGGMGGASYALSPATQLGFALGGGGTSFGLSDGLGAGRSDLFQAGVFARHNFAHNGYLTGAFAYGWHDVTTERIAPTGEHLAGAYKAHVLSGRVEAGWRLETAFAGVTPYAAAQAISYRLPSYREQGNGAADSFALGFTGRDVAATRSELGLRLDRTMALNDALVTLRGRAAWAHNFDTARALAATFQELPGTGFIVHGAAQAADAALVSAGAEIGWGNGLSLAATFEGEFSATTTSYAGRGLVKYAW